MAPWAFYWKEEDDEAWRDECRTRAEVIAAAVKELAPGTPFRIIEARLSDDKKHEGSDVIPFLRFRNGEHLRVVSDETGGKAAVAA